MDRILDRPPSSRRSSLYSRDILPQSHPILCTITYTRPAYATISFTQTGHDGGDMYGTMAHRSVLWIKKLWCSGSRFCVYSCGSRYIGTE